MNPAENAYGLWSLVIINSVFFILFAFSFFKPHSRRDWRTFGLYSAFIVALFTEMYGFPLTIYLFSGWLSEKFPGVDFLSHDAGHLMEVVFGWSTNPHFGPFHMLSIIFIGGRLLVAVQCMAGTLPISATTRAGDHKSICTYTPSAICCLCAGDVRLSAAMANLDNPAFVSCADIGIRAFSTARGG